MPPESPTLRQEASALAAAAVPTEPVDHHRPIDLRVVCTMAQTAAPAGETRSVEVGIPGAGEIGSQAAQYVLVEPDGAPKGASAGNVSLHGSIESLQRRYFTHDDLLSGSGPRERRR